MSVLLPTPQVIDIKVISLRYDSIASVAFRRLIWKSAVKHQALWRQTWSLLYLWTQQTQRCTGLYFSHQFIQYDISGICLLHTNSVYFTPFLIFGMYRRFSDRNINASTPDFCCYSLIGIMIMSWWFQTDPDDSDGSIRSSEMLESRQRQEEVDYLLDQNSQLQQEVSDKCNTSTTLLYTSDSNVDWYDAGMIMYVCVLMLRGRSRFSDVDFVFILYRSSSWSWMF